MEIVLNEEKIDFSLDKEQTILEVIEGLEKWVDSQDLFLADCEIDKKGLFLFTEAELQQSTNEVKCIKCNVYSGVRYAFECLSVVQSYLGRVRKYIENKTLHGEIENVKEGAAWLKYNLGKIIQILKLENNEPIVLEALKDFEIILFQFSNKDSMDENIYPKLGGKVDLILQNAHRLQFKLYLRTLGEKYKIFQKEYSQESVEDLLHTLESMRKVLPTIGENLQTGKDFEAMPYLSDVSTALSVMLYLLGELKKANGLDYASLVVEDKSMKDVLSQIKERLSSIETALKENNTIELGDLIEYELEEDLQTMMKLLDLLKEEMR